MVAEPAQRDPLVLPRERELARALGALADASRRVATSSSLADALAVVADTAAACAGADVAVVRSQDPTGRYLVARAVSAASPALAAELEGSRYELSALPDGEEDRLPRVAPPVRRAAERLGATALFVVPIRLGAAAASLELLRTRPAFDDHERELARLAAGLVAVAVRALEEHREPGTIEREQALDLLADALVAASDEDPGTRVARLAAAATAARSAFVWLGSDDGEPLRVAWHGSAPSDVEVADLRKSVIAALAERGGVALDRSPDGLVATLRLGEPPLGALQLVFTVDSAPSEADLGRLRTLGARAAQSLRMGDRTRGLAVELERTRALLAVLGQAIAQLSLEHTLETATARVSDLLGVERVAVYLLADGRLEAAAASGLVGPHAAVAERLLELALGPFRARGVLIVPDARAERRLAAVADAAAEADIQMVLAVPLRAHDDVIGLLAAYPERGRAVLPGETSLVTALAAQLAVAVQNARLHEEAKRLGAELRQALISERQAARQLRALYEISRVFVESRSLQRTLDVIARTVVETFDLDAAAIRMVDRRREVLVTRALHVADPAQADAIGALLRRPQPLSAALVDLVPTATPVLLDVETALRLGGAHELLVPFLARGSTAAIVPIATKNELVATLKLLSLDAARPITAELASNARTVAAQGALAIEHALLYQQQKEFADTMQRSLLPGGEPSLDGFELGHVYESSEQMDVGGDVYDFLVLDDGRLAIVLGDVTGHGIAATGEMAIAKFVFRSLGREHPEPADFLSSANEVLVGEVQLGTFITMAYVVVDLERGEVACATAGHPPPRLVEPDGSVAPLAASGLALGVDAGQAYDQTSSPIHPGGSIVLYTDGVVEARRDGELYGTARLDAVLARESGRSAGGLARAVIEDCRAFAGGELLDDCAVVVVKRSPD